MSESVNQPEPLHDAAVPPEPAPAPPPAAPLPPIEAEPVRRPPPAPPAVGAPGGDPAQFVPLAQFQQLQEQVKALLALTGQTAGEPAGTAGQLPPQQQLEMRMLAAESRIEAMSQSPRRREPTRMLESTPAVWVGTDDGSTVQEQAIDDGAFLDYTGGRSFDSDDALDLEEGMSFFADFVDYNGGDVRTRRVRLPTGSGGGVLTWMIVATGANADGVAICNKLDNDGDTLPGDINVKVFHQDAGDTLYAMQASPRTDALWEDDPDDAVTWTEVICAGNRDGYTTYPGDRSTPVMVSSTQLGDSNEGSDGAEGTDWQLADGPLDEWDLARVNYDDAGDEIIYGYARLKHFDSNSMRYEVETDVQYEIDEPDTCEAS